MSSSPSLLFASTFACLALLAQPGARAQQPPAAANQAANQADWVRGEGAALEMRIRGKLVNDKGEPFTDARLSAKWKTQYADALELPVTRQEHQFECWVPLAHGHMPNLYLDARSPDGDLMAFERVEPYALRDAALQGVTLTLKPVERTLSITVTDQGKPVEGAQVSIDTLKRSELTALTNAAGVARFPMYGDETLSEITAWTTDHRIGGYQFGRDPPRNPRADAHTIELSPCRPQKIRFTSDETGKPVADLGFKLYVATPEPFFNYIGLTPEASMTTNAEGEATFEWFPDWPKHYFYTDRLGKEWIKVGKDTLDAEGVIQVRVKRSAAALRKRIRGTVVWERETPAGFLVQLSSFQGERAGRIDFLHAFTDAQGRFEAEVLPGSTYVAAVRGDKLLSQMFHFLPFNAETGEIQEPTLVVAEGVPVEISVTQGPSHTPVVGQSVSLRATYPYEWLENGKRQSGFASRDTWGVTDENGVWKTFAMPGEEIQAGVFEPDWRMEQKAIVKAGEITKIALHRPNIVEQTITIQLALPADLGAKLENAEVHVCRLDRTRPPAQTLKADEKGRLAFQTTLPEFGLIARTTDGKAILMTIVDSEKAGETLNLSLTPSAEYRGKLLAEDGAPAANFTVEARPTLIEPDDSADSGERSFSIPPITTTTDANGEFTLRGLPYFAATTIVAVDNNIKPGEAPRLHYITEAYFEPGENRPLRVIRFTGQSNTYSNLKARFELDQRYALAGGFRHLLVAFDPAASSEEEVNRLFMDYDTMPEVCSFMHTYYRTSGPKWSAADDEFASTMKCPKPKEQALVAIAFDQTGNELGRVEMSLNDADAAEKAARFLREHMPPKSDAKKKWEKAFALAAKTNRKVWVRVSQRFCGPCHSLNLWLLAQQALLEKEYVLLKIDDVLDESGPEVAARLTVGDKRNHGNPFHAIFDASGKKLIDSAGPTGNIGCPSGFDGAKHLRKMLHAGGARLTEEEIETLLKSLPE